jgi:murein DD-endopeptidase MepM/ murein hydrolase activator NlpD
MLGVSLLALVSTGLGESQFVHKYKDAKGVWHFTDTLPQTDQTVESQEALASPPPQKVRIERQSFGSVDVINAANDYFGPVEITVEFTVADNIFIHNHGQVIGLPGDQTTCRYLLRAGQRARLFSIRPGNMQRGWQYKYQYTYVPGDPRARADEMFLYSPPFEGDQFPISQAFHGEFSHQDPHNRYAVDIAMPVGTPILNARAGVVMEAIGEYFWAGENLSYYGPRSNLIRILHDDGTMALYAHIQRGSLTVKEGQRVSAGEMIARSGNSGFSTGPHLHFCVLINQGMDVVSLPFMFSGPGGQGIVPMAGTYVSAGP